MHIAVQLSHTEFRSIGISSKGKVHVEEIVPSDRITPIFYGRC